MVVGPGRAVECGALRWTAVSDQPDNAETNTHRGLVREQVAVDALVGLLDLEAIEVNVFRGRSPAASGVRVFGGQVAGQALVAAARTIDHQDVAATGSAGGAEPARHVHSLHAYFLRPGDPAIPILYEVDRIRDGRSFTTRRVVAIQHGQPIFNLAASFHVEEPGLEFGEPMPDVPGPETLPTFKERLAPYRDLLGSFYTQPKSVDLRYVTIAPESRGHSAEPDQIVWFRAAGDLPDDPVLHTCVIAYASDMTLLDTTLVAHGQSSFSGGLQMASLDHAMWFHRSVRADEWLLYVQHSPWSGSGRGFARGTIFSADGRIVASVAQEGLIRPRV